MSAGQSFSRPRAVAGADEDAPRAGAMRELDIAPLIADHPGGAEIQLQVARCRFEHPRRRLATLACHRELGDLPLRVMRTVVPGDRRARLRQRVGQPSVRLLDKRVVVHPERDAALVGDDHDWEPCVGKARDRLSAERVDLDLGLRRDIPELVEHRSISIDEYGRFPEANN